MRILKRNEERHPNSESSDVKRRERSACPAPSYSLLLPIEMYRAKKIPRSGTHITARHI